MDLLENRRKFYMNRTVIKKFLAVLKLWKIVGNICFSEQIFYRKQSLGAPDRKTPDTDIKAILNESSHEHHVLPEIGHIECLIYNTFITAQQ